MDFVMQPATERWNPFEYELVSTDHVGQTRS